MAVDTGLSFLSAILQDELKDVRDMALPEDLPEAITPLISKLTHAAFGAGLFVFNGHMFKQSCFQDAFGI